ncbi:hypothetical protein MIND_00655600 [Mycena indigotica]|uniref:Uncharacterized protein n=1 Tax=Mycena indigotica TaxID=2126181 RepID=A0A8H6SMF8_9AGAR|nr:uncharacterized protein MIND_00655600 [Mycena indigotica]KAF7300927.1 hypothetical protein MIND_00655600 [Mycena indigotica]
MTIVSGKVQDPASGSAAFGGALTPHWHRTGPTNYPKPHNAPGTPAFHSFSRSSATALCSRPRPKEDGRA